MKHMTLPRLSPLAALALAALPMSAPVASAQSADVVNVRAFLSGANEVPNPAQSTGSHGSAVVTVNRAAGTIDYVVNVYNLPTGLTGAHIHVAPAGANGPIILDFRPQSLGISNDFALRGSLTAADLRPNAATGINSIEDAMFAIASGVTYVNIHTQANPGGEIRGQLCPESAQANTFNGVALCTVRP